MIEEGLKVKFTADTKELVVAGKRAEQTMGSMAQSIKSSAGSFNVAGKAANDASKQISKVPAAGNKATASLNDFSRIMQDVAYGPAAISNNLNPLIESFGRLRAETGSVKGALSAMVSGLAGGGGLGFAIAAVTTALSFASVGFSAWTRGMGGAGEETKKAKKAVDEVKDSLQDLAAITASTGVAEIYKYTTALTSVTLSTDQRRKALQEYNKIAAESNQLSEKDLGNIEKVNAATMRQINLLKSRALMRGAEDKLADAFKTIFEAQFKIQDQLKKANPTLEDAYELFKTPDKNQKDFVTGLGWEEGMKAAEQLGFNFKVLDKRGKEAAATVQSLLKYMGDLLPKADAFGGIFEGDGSKSKVKVKPDIESVDKAFNSIREYWLKLWLNLDMDAVPEIPVKFNSNNIQKLLDSEIGALKANAVDIQIDNPFAKLEGQNAITIDNIRRGYERLGKELPDFMKDADGKEISWGPRVNPELLNKELAVLKQLEETTKNTAMTISNVLAPAFQSLFGAIVSGEEPLRAFFKSIEQGVTQLMSQMLAAAVQAALLSAFFPGGAVASTGAIKGFSGFFKNILGFANGGIISGPTLGLVGEYAGARRDPEVIAPLSKLRSMLPGAGGGGTQRLYAEISGDKIKLQNRRTERRQRRNR